MIFPAVTGGCYRFTRSAARRCPVRSRTGIILLGTIAEAGEPRLDKGELRFPSNSAAEAITLALNKLADYIPKLELTALGKVADQLRPSFEKSSNGYAVWFRPPRELRNKER
jgi:hypothetical protein